MLKSISPSLLGPLVTGDFDSLLFGLISNAERVRPFLTLPYCSECWNDIVSGRIRAAKATP